MTSEDRDVLAAYLSSTFEDLSIDDDRHIREEFVRFADRFGDAAAACSVLPRLARAMDWHRWLQFADVLSREMATVDYRGGRTRDAIRVIVAAVREENERAK